MERSKHILDVDVGEPKGMNGWIHTLIMSFANIVWSLEGVTWMKAQR